MPLNELLGVVVEVDGDLPHICTNILLMWDGHHSVLSSRSTGKRDLTPVNSLDGQLWLPADNSQ
jgi:hypothetical protein